MSYLDELIEESKQQQKKSKLVEGIEQKYKEVQSKKSKFLKRVNESGQVEIKGKKVLVTSYANVKVYKVKGDPLLYYSVPVIKAKGPEKIIINTIKEAATRLITVSPEEIRDPAKRRDFYFKKIKEIIERSPELGVPTSKIDFYADMVVREMIGYGILDILTQDDKLEEIMVIGPNKPVYVFHRQYDMMKTNIMFGNDEEIRNVIDKIARQVSRRVDIQSPLLDARLPDGSRVNATIKPISLGGSTLTIRKFRTDPFSVVDLVSRNTLDSEAAAFLWLAVDGLGAKPANILAGLKPSRGSRFRAWAGLLVPIARCSPRTAGQSSPIFLWLLSEFSAHCRSPGPPCGCPG